MVHPNAYRPSQQIYMGKLQLKQIEEKDVLIETIYDSLDSDIDWPAVTCTIIFPYDYIRSMSRDRNICF